MNKRKCIICKGDFNKSQLYCITKDLLGEEECMDMKHREICAGCIKDLDNKEYKAKVIVKWK